MGGGAPNPCRAATCGRKLEITGVPTNIGSRAVLVALWQAQSKPKPSNAALARIARLAPGSCSIRSHQTISAHRGTMPDHDSIPAMRLAIGTALNIQVLPNAGGAPLNARVLGMLEGS